jgi:hypothetical protein
MAMANGRGRHGGQIGVQVARPQPESHVEEKEITSICVYSNIEYYALIQK